MNTERTRTTREHTTMEGKDMVIAERKIICDGCLFCQEHCECGPRGTPAPCDL